MSELETLEKLTVRLDRAVISRNSDRMNTAFDKLVVFSESEISQNTKEKALKILSDYVEDQLAKTINKIDKTMAEYEAMQAEDNYDD